MRNLIKLRSNIVGSLASFICLVHCIATPFLFVAHASHHQDHSHHHAHPFWWGLIDVIFLVISLLAVYWSTKQTSATWVKWVLALSWGFLAIILINEKLGWFHLVEELIYLPSIALIITHLINIKYCQCDDNEECCVRQ